MHVNLARADLAAAWHSDTGFTEAPDERPEDGNARAHLRDEFVRSLVFIDGGRVDGQRMVGAAFDIGTEMGKDFVINEGDGAFYGPKLDFHLADSLGRTWQCGTIQLDFQMPERFELEYTGEDGQKHRPVMIHRVVLGSIERFIGVITEHFAGAFPLWLAPEQVKILPISDKFHGYAEEVRQQLDMVGLRVSVDTRSEKIGYKIREAQLHKIPYMLVIGEKEVESGTVSVRKRGEGDIGAMSIADFIDSAKTDVAEKAIW